MMVNFETDEYMMFTLIVVCMYAIMHNYHRYGSLCNQIMAILLHN